MNYLIIILLAVFSISNINASKEANNLNEAMQAVYKIRCLDANGVISSYSGSGFFVNDNQTFCTVPHVCEIYDVYRQYTIYENSDGLSIGNYSTLNGNDNKVAEMIKQKVIDSKIYIRLYKEDNNDLLKEIETPAANISIFFTPLFLKKLYPEATKSIIFYNNVELMCLNFEKPVNDVKFHLKLQTRTLNNPKYYFIGYPIKRFEGKKIAIITAKKDPVMKKTFSLQYSDVINNILEIMDPAFNYYDFATENKIEWDIKGMSGGPVVDAEGKLISTLSYSPSPGVMFMENSIMTVSEVNKYRYIVLGLPFNILEYFLNVPLF